jgi:peptide-methionine (S)-S-oxide reductase
MHTQLITLGGGCFWCLEAVYQELVGVKEVISGYAGGSVESPTYAAVCDGVTGHAEVVQIHFDPEKVSLRQILEVFYVIHDPTTLNRQGHDVGSQYRSVIYCEDQSQIDVALALVEELTLGQVYKDPIVTEIIMAPTFYRAEDYHQNYYVTHPYQGYCVGVVAPKLDKFRKNFAQLKKKSD